MKICSLNQLCKGLFSIQLWLLTSCSSPAYKTKVSYTMPYADLTGLLPPPSTEQKAPALLITNLHNFLFKYQGYIPYDEDIKKTCTNLLHACASSHRADIAFATLNAYSLLQMPPDERIIDLILKRDYNPYLQLQLLLTLYETNSPDCLHASEYAMQSNYPLIQLYASEYITRHRAPQALARLESLEAKIPQDLLSYLTELYAIEGSSRAQAHIKRLLSSGDTNTICVCLLVIRHMRLVELYDELKNFIPTNSQEEESLAFALGADMTSSAEKRLTQLSLSPHPSVAITALVSLTELGQNFSLQKYQNLIDTHSPFVLSNLWKTSFSTQSIEALWTNDLDATQRLALALSLLERRSTIPLAFLKASLLSGNHMLFSKSYSAGGQSWFLCIQTQGDNEENEGRLYESQSLQEALIQKIAIHFPEQFCTIVQEGLCSTCPHLGPAIIFALESMSTETSRLLLEQLSVDYSQPFLQKIALFTRMKQKGITLNPELLATMVKEMRQRLSSFVQPSPWTFFSSVRLNEKDRKKLTEQQRLYVMGISLLAQDKTKTSSDLIASELQAAPELFVPFITAALLHSYL